MYQEQLFWKSIWSLHTPKCLAVPLTCWTQTSFWDIYVVGLVVTHEFFCNHDRCGTTLKNTYTQQPFLFISHKELSDYSVNFMSYMSLLLANQYHCYKQWGHVHHPMQSARGHGCLNLFL